MITMSARAQEIFEEERRRQGRPNLGIQISFLYGCGGAGFRVTFTDEPQDVQFMEEAGRVRVFLDAQSRDTLQGAVIDWEGGPLGGFVLRHPEAVLVDFC